LIVYSPQSDIYEDVDSMSQDRLDSKEIFLQHDTCYFTSLEISQCRECKENSKDCNKYTCRFYQFRRIQKEDGKFEVTGFLDIHSDPSLADLDMWTVPDSRLKLSNESVNYILTYIGSQFCFMAQEELNVCKLYKQNHQVAWKRAVYLVRELCDVCATSLFNFHFVCTLCGTSICIDCYKEREAGFARWKLSTKAEREERDNFFWYKCHDEKNHNLMLTQNIPGDALLLLQENLHKVCKEQNIPLKCDCYSKAPKIELSKDPEKNLFQQQAIQRKRLKKMRIDRTISSLENTTVYNRIKHTWVAGKNVIKFLEPSESEEAYKLFQSQWQRGKPIVVANVIKNMKIEMWNPKYFLGKFGNNKHSLVNCTNDTIIKRVPLRHFWEGFQSYKKRLPVESDKKLVLKLKDFPTASDFADTLKDHFADMMKTVPFSAYSRRDGKYNLPKYLHEHFLKPDLGPKMYSAYGQELPLRQSSTNLHLDISDAINVCVHVSQPDDAHLAPTQYKKEEVRKAMVAAGCDEEDLRILDSNLKLPGAIWYIWKASQANDIRKVLHQVAKERGKHMGKNEDPLHDQDWFIDAALRARLKENGVDGYTIIQYAGEAVFIPSGAPHQVTNLYDCIKVALDFVAPENILESFNLTSEFRRLSTRHANREDKLQIKSILYHVVKSLVPSKIEYEL
jgi:lysine-specific demethylase 3